MKFVKFKKINGKLFKVYELNNFDEMEVSPCEYCDIKKFIDCEESGGLPCGAVMPLSEAIGKNFIFKEVDEKITVDMAIFINNSFISQEKINLSQEEIDQITSSLKFIGTKQYTNIVKKVYLCVKEKISFAFII